MGLTLSTILRRLLVEPAETTRRSRTTRRSSLSRPTRRSSLSRPTRRSSLSRPTRRSSLSRPTRRSSLSRPTRRSSLSRPTRRSSLSRPGLDTRSLALAARPAATSAVEPVETHPTVEPVETRSRHPLAGARCSTSSRTSGGRACRDPPGGRACRDLDRADGRACRDPVSTPARWRSLLDQQQEPVETGRGAPTPAVEPVETYLRAPGAPYDPGQAPEDPRSALRSEPRASPGTSSAPASRPRTPLPRARTPVTRRAQPVDAGRCRRSRAPPGARRAAPRDWSCYPRSTSRLRT